MGTAPACVPSSQGRARLWQGSEPGDSKLWHLLLHPGWQRGRAWGQRGKGDISCEGCSALDVQGFLQPGELLHFLICYFGLLWLLAVGLVGAEMFSWDREKLGAD